MVSQNYRFMKEEDKLKATFGKNTGFSVPEGYFESMRVELEKKLPPYPEPAKPMNLSMWQRVKPYVYLAAMFAGIWLMMQVFHRVQPSGDLMLENPPENIVLAMAAYDADGPELLPRDISDYELQSDVVEEYGSMNEIEKAFGYELEPEYASIEIPD